MEFYILQNKTKQGPYSLDELKEKNIDVDTMVWSVGFSNWKPAKNIPELSDLLSGLPPVPPPMSKTWLAESILVTIFCCLPFGIVGIVNASKVSSLYAKGDYTGAQQASANAKKWTKIGFYIGLTVIIIYLLSLLVTILLALNN